MTEQRQKNDGASFLGVSFAYPKTLWATLPFAFACATIAFIAYLFLHSSPEQSAEPRRVWTPIVIMTNGIQTIQGDMRRMEFWTPSARTKDYVAREGGGVRERDKWEILSSDEPVIEFGKLLRSDSSVAGYRRAEVWGHGRTILKPGWWWTMTVTTNYPVDKLMRTYRDFWKSPNSVFVEVIDNGGIDEP